MFCEKCGAKNPDGSQFCSACGSPMGGAAPTSTQAKKAAPAVSAGGKKIDLKVVVILAVAALAVLVLLFVFLGRSGGSTADSGGVAEQARLEKDDLVGRWYREYDEQSREVFWFQGSGILTYWQESGGFTEAKGDNGNGTHLILGNWSLAGDHSIELLNVENCGEDSVQLVNSYFGGGKSVTVILSDDSDSATFRSDGSGDFVLQKYPGSRW